MLIKIFENVYLFMKMSDLNILKINDFLKRIDKFNSKFLRNNDLSVMGVNYIPHHTP